MEKAGGREGGEERGRMRRDSEESEGRSNYTTSLQDFLTTSLSPTLPLPLLLPSNTISTSTT